jgi:stalled ribosome alternative rescue factor ArfA
MPAKASRKRQSIRKAALNALVHLHFFNGKRRSEGTILL